MEVDDGGCGGCGEGGRIWNGSGGVTCPPHLMEVMSEVVRLMVHLLQNNKTFLEIKVVRKKNL